MTRIALGVSLLLGITTLGCASYEDTCVGAIERTDDAFDDVVDVATGDDGDDHDDDGAFVSFWRRGVCRAAQNGMYQR